MNDKQFAAFQRNNEAVKAALLAADNAVKAAVIASDKAVGEAEDWVRRRKVLEKRLCGG